MYELHFQYLPRRGYSSFTNLKPRSILKYVGKSFLVKLHALLKKNVKSKDSDDLILGKQTTTGKTKETDEDDEKKAKNVSLF